MKNLMMEWRLFRFLKVITITVTMAASIIGNSGEFIYKD